MPLFFFSTRPPPPRSTLFPYTTLFRSTDQKKATIQNLNKYYNHLFHRKYFFTHWSSTETKPDYVTCAVPTRSEEHTSELQSRRELVCRLLLEKKNTRGSSLRLRTAKAT